MKVNSHRDAVIRRAVAAGKFAQHRIPHWRAEWDRNPRQTEELIDRLEASDPRLLAESEPPERPVTARELEDLFGRRAA